MLGGLTALLANLWLELPTHWYPSYFTGAPVLGGLLAILAQELWRTRKERKSQGTDPEWLEKFIVSIEYIDQGWHQVFELTESLIEQGRELFGEVNQELYEEIGDVVSDATWRYKGVTEITAESLRISDSIICQLRTGHPDTSLATVRQLFELAIFQKVIALDRSGEAAQRYQDFSEVRYLQDAIDSRKADKGSLGRRLGEIKRRYPQGTSFKPLFAWIKLPNGDSPSKMEDVIEYTVREIIRDTTQRKKAKAFFLERWVKLNYWTHITKPASRRKLGLRSKDGYRDVHLLEKSNVGLETPLSIAVIFLQYILETLEATGCDLTGKSHTADLEKVADLVRQICLALDSVAADLLANDFRIKWQPTAPSTEETKSAA